MKSLKIPNFKKLNFEKMAPRLTRTHQDNNVSFDCWINIKIIKSKFRNINIFLVNYKTCKSKLNLKESDSLLLILFEKKNQTIIESNRYYLAIYFRSKAMLLFFR
jgi:hypothetical protein